MAGASGRWSPFRTVSDDEQDPALLNAPEDLPQKFETRRIDPVRILEQE